MAEGSVGKKVGRVLDIDGPRLMYTRQFKSGLGKFQAYKGMPIYIGDVFSTDDKTTAVLEFDIGGQSVVAPGYDSKVVGLRDTEALGNQFLIKAGKIWAKIDKQKSQLQIQTSGGVIGIEG